MLCFALLSIFKAWRLPADGESKQYVDSSLCLPATSGWLGDCSPDKGMYKNYTHTPPRPVGTAATSRKAATLARLPVKGGLRSQTSRPPGPSPRCIGHCPDRLGTCQGFQRERQAAGCVALSLSRQEARVLARRPKVRGLHSRIPIRERDRLVLGPGQLESGAVLRVWVVVVAAPEGTWRFGRGDYVGG